MGQVAFLIHYKHLKSFKRLDLLVSKLKLFHLLYVDRMKLRM